jgi:hypothetical protein
MNELHFYPGIHLLVVFKGKSITRRFEAWGGPEFGGSDPRMAEQPTKPGKYVIQSISPYTTPTWAFSKIKWGTPLRDMPGDIWYKLSSGKWGSVKKDLGLTKEDVKREYLRLYKKYKVPATWVFNDFGPVAIRYFKDLNHNRVLDSNESLSGDMIHTTPDNEAEYALGKKVKLFQSHGCIHVRPQDRSKLNALGLFKPGTTFVVHKYDEHI